jgi:hypothetical protein
VVDPDPDAAADTDASTGAVAAAAAGTADSPTMCGLVTSAVALAAATPGSDGAGKGITNGDGYGGEDEEASGVGEGVHVVSSAGLRVIGRRPLGR